MRSERKVWAAAFVNTHSPIPTVPERVGAHVQANSKSKCPSDNRAKEHACKVEPAGQQRNRRSRLVFLLFLRPKAL